MDITDVDKQQVTMNDGRSGRHKHGWMVVVVVVTAAFRTGEDGWIVVVDNGSGQTKYR